MSTLILTAAVGYTEEQIRASPFYCSLNEHGSSDITLHIVKDAPEEYSNIAVQSWWRFEALRYLFEQTDRWEYDRVILTDFRDVIFQGNPNKIPVPYNGGVHCFYEDSRMKVKDCAYNSLWIARDYGHDVLEKYGNRSISCCGVVVGDSTGIQEYLEETTEEIKRLGKWEVGIDTSVHNYLMWTQEFRYSTFQNENPWVYTVGHCLSISVSKKKILNRMSQTPIIVHQWDRHL